MHKDVFTVACIKWGKKYAPCYANILYDMVRRNLPEAYPFTFVCFTDNPEGLHPEIVARPLPGDLEGWWNKLWLFKKGIFEDGQPILYFDLDTLITGPLDGIAAYRGRFALLREFYQPGHIHDRYGSGVMLWRAGACSLIWESYDAAGRPNLHGGDQAWIERVYLGADMLQDLFPGVFVSYKIHCRPLPPEGACVVCFHGDPKQDNCQERWVQEVWKIGGAAVPPDASYRTHAQEQLDHVRTAASLPYPWLAPALAHETHAVIIGSGPSLRDCASELRRHVHEGHQLFAVNYSYRWLEKNAIAYNAHVLFGAAGSDDTCLSGHEIACYYASTCHPDSFARAHGPMTVWHPRLLGIGSLLKDDPRPKHFIEGGDTAGLKAIELAYALGYRNLHLYGFDSCFDGSGARNVLEQPHHAR